MSAKGHENSFHVWAQYSEYDEDLIFLEAIIVPKDSFTEYVTSVTTTQIRPQSLFNA